MTGHILTLYLYRPVILIRFKLQLCADVAFVFIRSPVLEMLIVSQEPPSIVYQLGHIHMFTGLLTFRCLEAIAKFNGCMALS